MRRLCFISITAVLLLGCTTARLTLKPSLNLKGYKKVYIIPRVHDSMGLNYKLAQRFQEYGFEIVSKEEIKNALMRKDMVTYAYNLDSTVVLKEVGKHLDLDAFIEYDYLESYGTNSWMFERIDITMSDSKTGEKLLEGSVGGTDPRSLEGMLDRLFLKFDKHFAAMPEPSP